MTSLAVVKTSSNVIIAADSRITTNYFIGRDEAGDVQLGTQIYQLGTKIAQSESGGVVCAVAGALGGWESPMDHFGSATFWEAHGTNSNSYTPDATGARRQQEHIESSCKRLAEKRAAFWKSIQPDVSQWPGTTVVLSAFAPDSWCPRVWALALEGEEPTFQEVLAEPGVMFFGSPTNVLSLMQGFQWSIISALQDELGVDEEEFHKKLIAAVIKILTPQDRISFINMPLHEAIDLAYFLANVQVQMDRFVAGQEACGGPIDIAIIHGRPKGKVTILQPGKELQHPAHRWRAP